MGDIFENIKDAVFETGKGIIRKVALDGLANLLGGKPEDHKDTEAERISLPIFAEMTQALLEADLLQYVLSGAIRSVPIARQVWELRRPYDQKIAEMLSDIGKKGNPE